MNYDGAVHREKNAFTNFLMDTKEDDPKWRNLAANRVDALNAAWDELTDALVRQRDERDRLISRLLNDLAEANRDKG